ncbi:MAG: NDP-sugar synthase [Zetaproteobacteria bacterium]|nr:MAG: NDP-sugar synthase [Zetaproteobacteria bacterium]
MPASDARACAVLIDPGRRVDELSRLLGRIPLPLLPVGGKPLIQHWFERLSEAGVREVLLLLAHLPEKTRAFVGDGARWGLQVRSALVREDAPLAKKLLHARTLPEGPVLLADMHLLPVQGFAEWWHKYADVDCVLVPDDQRGRDDPWFAAPALGDRRPTVRREACGEDVFRPIISPRALWQANMDLLDGVIEDPLPLGFETEPGVRIANHCRVDDKARLEAPCIVGEGSLLGERCRLRRSVIGASVIADEHSEVRDSVVFDHTFIGSHIELNRVLASGHMLYKVDEDVLMFISDHEILSDTKRPHMDVVPLSHRVAAASLLLLLSPVLLGLVLWLSLRGREPWLRETLYIETGWDFSGERVFRPLKVRSLNVRHPVRRKLPWLWHVLRGELALTGVTPRHSPDNALPIWVSDGPWGREGVITLADVAGASMLGEESDATYIADAYFQATGGGMDFSLIFRWLLSLFKRAGMN